MINWGRSGLSPLIGLLLLTVGLSGCGTGSGDQIDPITPTSSQAPPTSTTTTSAVTTTTIPEIRVDPPSGLPPVSLAEAFGGPAVAETACIDLDISPGVIDPEELRLTVFDAFRFLGVGIVDTDCDVRLSVSLQGGRYSALYGGFLEECFTGYTIEGAVTASASGFEDQWPVDVDSEPLSSIRKCDGDENPPGGPVPRYRVYEPIDASFEMLFGPIGGIAIPFGSASRSSLRGDPSEEVVLEALASGLYMEDPLDRCRVVKTIRYWQWTGPSGNVDRDRSDLMPLVPHLIATYLDLTEIDHDTYLSGDDGLWNCDGLTDETLWDIVEEEEPQAPRCGVGCPAEWAAWWLNRQEN